MAKQLPAVPPRLCILRRREVEARTGLSRSTIYLRCSRNSSRPPSTSAAARSAGWRPRSTPGSRNRSRLVARLASELLEATRRQSRLAPRVAVIHGNTSPQPSTGEEAPHL